MGDVMSNETIIAVVVPLAGFLFPFLGVVVGHWFNRRKLNAEATNIETQGHTAIVGTAITLVEPLRKEIETLRQDLNTERIARRADADSCKSEISLRDTEIAILKRELNKLNRKFNAHEASIQKLKTDTDDLATRTPPPLTIPADPTPPLPTRSAFQDRPSDQPPDDAD